jgi:hypothetical protein
MAETPGTIVCRLCMTAVPVRFRRSPGSDVSNGWAGLLMDTRPLVAHFNSCDMKRPSMSINDVFVLAPVVPQADLAARINTVLNVATLDGGRHFVATGGSRACTMCGRPGEDCLSQLTSQARANPGNGGTPCCAACENGNTHPAPGEAFGTCAEWAADRGTSH